MQQQKQSINLTADSTFNSRYLGFSFLSDSYVPLAIKLLMICLSIPVTWDFLCTGREFMDSTETKLNLSIPVTWDFLLHPECYIELSSDNR